MKLYKINNNIYPNQDFQFTLTPEILGMSPSVHSHAYEDITGISSIMSGKANIGHEHNYVTDIYVESARIPSTHSITISITTTSGASGSLSISGDAIVIAYTSQKTNRVTGLLNGNLNEGMASVEFSSVDISSLDNAGVCVLTMTENDYD